MSILTKPHAAVYADSFDPEPSVIDAASWDAWCARNRTNDPPAEPCLPASDWLEAQAVALRCDSRNEDDLFDLLAAELNAVAAAFRRSGATTVREFVEITGNRYLSVGELEDVIMPERHLSELADEIDAIARPYLESGTDLGKLAAQVIFDHGDEAERLRAPTLRHYYAAIDAEEAAEMRMARDADSY